MRDLRHFITVLLLGTGVLSAHAQFDKSGISAGFFDSSLDKTINFSTFHLPPLAVLFENAKSNPQILRMAKVQELREAETAKEKKHVFSFISGHASYSYGKGDVWGNNKSTVSPILYQYQANKQSYWNVGASLNFTLDDLLDLGQRVKRSRLEAEQAQLEKDYAYDQLKYEIAQLYVRITNNLVALKTASENAAIYQGAGALNLEDFHNGNLSIQSFAKTKEYESGAVTGYQNLQTSITNDIIQLEILTHTPIITNSTTEITLDKSVVKSDKQIAKENKEMEKQIKKEVEAEKKLEEQQKKTEELLNKQKSK